MSASPLLKVITGGAAALLICLYPFWAWWGLSRFGILPVALSLAGIMLLRALMSPSRKNFGFAGIALVLASLSARLRTPDLPPEGVRWCRGVTQVWCGFFVLNGCVALATVLYGDRGLWMIWNGCVSYVLIGILFAGEFLLRRIRMRRAAARK